MKKLHLSLFLALGLASCGSSDTSGPIDIALIGDPQSVFQQGVRLSPAAQHLRGASFEGLVGLDPAGQIIPGVAERWIVTDDGRSYIFRLRNTGWPDGEPITSEDIAELLRDTIARLEGTSLGLDLAKITEIRAMTGRVVELRLSSPMPDFLRVLAQPELGFVKDGLGAGPMQMSRDGETDIARLEALPPEARGLPPLEDWEEGSRILTVRAMPAEAGVEAFSNGDIDLLMNGRLSTLPLAQASPLSRGAIQVDPTLGIYGLAFRHDNGLLGSRVNREALSMAIDRNALIQRFGLDGWQATSWIVPRELFSEPAFPETRWSSLSMDERRAIAARRITSWKTDNGGEAVVRVGLPSGPGSDLLFEALAADWGRIGVRIVRTSPGSRADVELRDRLARYSSPRWFLNQFNCGLEIGICSSDADAIVERSLGISDPAEKDQAYSEAQAALIANEVFIPLGAPVRWSLVRGALESYVPNQWGLHPLFPMSQPTT